MEDFERETRSRIAANGENSQLQDDATAFLASSLESQYSYNFSWLGRPIIQYPQDIIAMQEIIWSVKPDLIVETGIAHGGSLILWASMLELNASCGGPQDARVVGVDIDIRKHNRVAIEDHPMSKRIDMIEGSSVAPEIVEQVRTLASERQTVLVCLDSNHTHDHVSAELEDYAPLTTLNSYCIVFDTIVEDFSECGPSDRPWSKGNNPMTAMREYLKNHPEFRIDKSINSKLLISAAPDGYLKRIA